MYSISNAGVVRHNSEPFAAMPAKLKNLYQANKLDLQIHLHNKRQVYTTLDQIDGVVAITATVDTRFDDVEIEFVGTARTFVERLTTAAAISGRSEAFHQFLKLQQPRLHQHFPEDGVLKAGQKYEFPFVFVVPQQLLPRVCQHRVVSPAVRDAHLHLLPTFGDRDTGVKGGSVDDMVPDMASVRYGIFARVVKDKASGDDVVKTSLATKAALLRVLPASAEQPPLDVRADDGEYVMRREKTVRKGMLKGKLGTLVLEATQPPSLGLRPGRSSEAQTMAAIMLRFDPIDEKSPPPRVSGVSSKLRVHTFYASSARLAFPNRTAALLDMAQGSHSEQINLSSRSMNSVEWKKHDPSKPETLERRDSAFSVSSASAYLTPEASEAYKGGVFYVARLVVPITLPANKSFVPTFHSCLISRVYELKLDLGLTSSGIRGSLELRIPLQITYDGSRDASDVQRGSVDSQMETEVDGADIADFFGPRVIHAPAGHLVGRSRIGSQAPVDDAPPGYSFLASTNPRNGRSVSVF